MLFTIAHRCIGINGGINVGSDRDGIEMRTLKLLSSVGWVASLAAGCAAHEPVTDRFPDAIARISIDVVGGIAGTSMKHETIFAADVIPCKWRKVREECKASGFFDWASRRESTVADGFRVVLSVDGRRPHEVRDDGVLEWECNRLVELFDDCRRMAKEGTRAPAAGSRKGADGSP